MFGLNRDQVLSWLLETWMVDSVYFLAIVLAFTFYDLKAVVLVAVARMTGHYVATAKIAAKGKS